MKNRQRIFKILKVIIFSTMICGSFIIYVSDKNTWELGDFLFNNTILITGIIGVFFELYGKNVTKL
ncbi:hypothetical protein RJI07_01630 [Mycoplasmatota bacterium WC30]